MHVFKVWKLNWFKFFFFCFELWFSFHQGECYILLSTRTFLSCAACGALSWPPWAFLIPLSFPRRPLLSLPPLLWTCRQARLLLALYYSFHLTQSFSFPSLFQCFSCIQKISPFSFTSFYFPFFFVTPFLWTENIADSWIISDVDRFSLVNWVLK